MSKLSIVVIKINRGHGGTLSSQPLSTSSEKLQEKPSKPGNTPRERVWNLTAWLEAQ